MNETMQASLKQAKKVARDISKNKQVKAIYLFGSYARGTQTPLSDIDICVITEYNSKKIRQEFYFGQCF